MVEDEDLNKLTFDNIDENRTSPKVLDKDAQEHTFDSIEDNNLKTL